MKELQVLSLAEALRVTRQAQSAYRMTIEIDKIKSQFGIPAAARAADQWAAYMPENRLALEVYRLMQHVHKMRQAFEARHAPKPLPFEW